MESKYARVRATAQNFDETGYLRANPDVAAAVSAGRIPSGRAHFDQYGQDEGRFLATAVEAPFTFYESRFPSHENAFDLFAGRWSSQVPGYGYGDLAMFDDPRLDWFVEQVGDVKGRRILELGPLEGAHTCALARAGARVTAIEGNSGAYLRCLIVKEALGFDATFLLGDFAPFLAATTERFDAILASGVLYHMEHPIAFLDHLTRLSDILFLWTHYFDEESIRARNLRHKFADAPIVAMHGESKIDLWEQRYLDALSWGGFCGGPARISHWLTRDGLLAVLRDNGFVVSIGFDQPEHPNGPAFALLARRQS